MKWAILGTGSIARQFAGGLKVSSTGTLTSVGSRSMESAQKFCDEFGGQPFSTYQEAIDRDDVDAVYIALPHHMHSEWTIKSANAKKAILCEKPFTLTYPEAVKTLEVVKKAGVFFMEAFMYRCHPQTLAVQKMITDGKIGEPEMIDVEFGFSAPADWNNFRTVNAYGGGAMMDVGCYCVSFCRLIFGSDPVKVCYSARIGAKNYDEVGVGTLSFAGGRSAHFGTAFHLTLRNQAVIHGTQGHIVVDDPWKVHPGSKVRIYKSGALDPSETFDYSTSNDNLYAHEADEVARCAGGHESPRVTWADTLSQMKTLDALRKDGGLTFEGEGSR